jgi:mono/diheme cytochrome c family protein
VWIVRVRLWQIAVVAGVVVAAGTAAVIWAGRPQGRADPTDPTQVALGQRAYVAQCASCHGANLEGQPNWRQRLPNDRLPAPPHDASGHTWHHPDRVLFEITKDGIAAHAPKGYESDMPSFAGKISDNEIWAVLAYIKSTWPREIRERQAQISRRAE